MAANRFAKDYPTTNFESAVDELGYSLTLEILNMNRVHMDPLLAKDNMRRLIEEYTEHVKDQAYDRGMEAGIGLGKLAND